jgi:hypothetical protein
MYCPECGKENEATAQACASCGLNLVKCEAFSPYNPPINTGFLGASFLLFGPSLILVLWSLQAAVQYVLPEGYDEPVLKFDGALLGGTQYGALAAALIFSIAGLIAVMKSREADKHRRQDNQPDAASSAVAANKMAKFGWLFAGPILGIVLVVAFMEFVSGSHAAAADLLIQQQAGELDGAAPAEGAAAAPAAEGAAAPAEGAKDAAPAAEGAAAPAAEGAAAKEAAPAK